MIGTTLSRYRVIAKLGAGGMGEVYLAEDTRLQRRVALKVLPPELAADPERLRRLQREARILATLDHPHIVSVFSVEEEKGLHFLTMVHVEGRRLDEVIPPRGFPLPKLLDLAIPLADAVRAAHEKGIVHRDLKPGNLMIDREGRLRVLDFGLARIEAVADPEEITQLATGTLTRAGVVLGTYPYMSPEQVEGQVADARSDLFAVGIVLYEMATGKRPFSGKTPASLISSILREAPPAVTDLRTDLPGEFAHLVDDCLQKDPESRLASAEKLRERLEDLRQRFVFTRKPNEAATWRRRLAAPTATLAILVAFAAWLFVSWPERGVDHVMTRDRTSPSVSLVVLPLRNLSGDPQQQLFVDGVTEALITDLSRIGALRVISRTSAMRFRDSDKSLSEIAGELGVEAVIEGSVLREEERVAITAQLIDVASDRTLWADRYERDLTSILAVQAEIARAVANEIQVTLTPEEEKLLSSTPEVDPEAHEAYLKGMFHLRRFTPQEFQTSLRYFRSALEIDPDYAQAHYGISQVWNYSFVLGIEEPRIAGPRALAAVTRALELDGDLAEAHLGLANIRTSHTWDWEGAERAYRRALEINPNYAEARIFYSHLLLILNRLEEARAQSEQALALDPLEPFFRAAYAVVLGCSGDFQESIEVFREVHRNAPDFGFVHQPMFRILNLVGEKEEAMEHARLHLIGVDEMEAVVAMDGGWAAGGYREAMRRAAATLAEGSRLAARRPIFIANLYETAGDTRSALDWIERAYEIKDIDVAYLGTTLWSDEVRSHPRFSRLIEKIGVPLLRVEPPVRGPPAATPLRGERAQRI